MTLIDIDTIVTYKPGEFSWSLSEVGLFTKSVQRLVKNGSSWVLQEENVGRVYTYPEQSLAGVPLHEILRLGLPYAKGNGTHYLKHCVCRGFIIVPIGKGFRVSLTPNVHIVSGRQKRDNFDFVLVDALNENPDDDGLYICCLSEVSDSSNNVYHFLSVSKDGHTAVSVFVAKGRFIILSETLSLLRKSLKNGNSK